MTVVNYATGEVVELDSAAAERRAERITLRLDAIADNYRAVLPMIREAIEKRDDIALGYRSPGDYVSDRFGQSLAGLGIEVRRAVVGELTQAGLSTRAIAPVVGASQKTVARDARAARESHDSPDPKLDPQGALDAVVARADQTFSTSTSTSGREAAVDVGETPQGEVTPDAAATAPVPSSPVEPHTSTAPRPADPAPQPVIGIDGKTYKRPEPKARPRKPLADGFRDASLDLDKIVGRWERLIADDRFPRNRNEVARYANDLIRAREALDRLIEQMSTN